MDRVHRILDANFNRAGEALRAAEEYARFVIDAPGASERLKRARHSLAQARNGLEARLGGVRFSASRDILGDVGRAAKTEGEMARRDAGAVRDAALRRAEEALRALSEYGKLIDPGAAAELEALRYEVYVVEPLLQANPSARAALNRALLYVLVTTELCLSDPLVTAREAIGGGADMIQLREKNMEDGEFFRLASKMAGLCREGGALLTINDRPHIAALVGAAGVHGGQGDLPVHLTRRILGPDRIVGRSTSEPALAERALADGADYIGVGPVYETNTKKHRRAVGVEYVDWAAKWDKLPFFAIGSVNRETVDFVLAAGARRLAICTAITKARDVAAEAAFFKEKLLAPRNGK
ncbi:MAG: thiamine phosphate synthase [Planctomycetota bacterium]|nr:thiamine phosphate synthase [Planctomycetota bacterium]